MDPFVNTMNSTVVQDPLNSPALASRLHTASYIHDLTFPPSLIISRLWMPSGTLGDLDCTDSPTVSMDIYEEEPPPVAERWGFITGSNRSDRFIVCLAFFILSMTTDQPLCVAATNFDSSSRCVLFRSWFPPLNEILPQPWFTAFHFEICSHISFPAHP